MDTLLLRFKNVLFLAVLLIVQTVGLAVQVRRPADAGGEGAEASAARSWVVGAVAPLERLVSTSARAVANTWSQYLDLRGARRENRDLQRQIAAMQLQQAALAEDAVQGQRLQALLGFQERYVSATVAAQVIGTGGSDLSRVVYIDKGAADGLKPEMAVVTPDGVIGKIRDVFAQASPHTAQVLLINDPTSGAGVVLEQTRLRAVVHGNTAGEVHITNLTRDERIKPGERVVTSGGDQVFPRGLAVGTVESITPDPERPPYTDIRIRPAANLSQIEEVLVITGTEPSLPRAKLDELQRQALASAQARAAAEKAAAAKAAADAAAKEQAETMAHSAAEAASDRLPSLRNDASATAEQKAAQADAANPKAAGGVVPKPVPTVHPDRYTPGKTPSATELKPGAPRTQPPAGPQSPSPASQTASPEPQP